MYQLLPEKLYTAEQVRQLDSIAINAFGIPGFELMNRAAKATFDTICMKWSNLSAMQVFCGAGNNAGDGYLVAALAQQKNIDVSVITLKDPEQLTGDALQAWQHCCAAGVPIASFDDSTEISAELVVDAMLGTGLSGEVRGPYQQAIRLINQSAAACCAVDIPSGLCADTGMPLGDGIKANLTVSFIGLKQGLLTGMGKHYCGELHFDDLNIPKAVYEKVSASCQRIHSGFLKNSIAPRSQIAHKGDSGHVLLIGGNYGMPGAIIMAAEAAIHCGAGKVTVATRKEHLSALAIRCPEIMAQGIESKETIQALLQDKNAVVIGPGLGQDQWAFTLLCEALATDASLVLDADALNLLSQYPQLHRKQNCPMILTPHPGEAARLLQTDIDDIQRDRFITIVKCVERYNAVTLLKGAGTLISDGSQMSLCSAGNPGMAVAGMGDILSGVLGALLAQGIEPLKATQLACWLHSSAADDIVAKQGEIGLLASELIPMIRTKMNRLNN